MIIHINDSRLVIMRQKKLEMLLQKVPEHPSPRPDLEQYTTPASIAADMLYQAHSRGDVAGKTVVDLGCGTGIFCVGAKLLGASTVLGVEVDPGAVEVARTYCESEGLEVEFVNLDVADYSGSCDTVIMNPPFGSQTKRADRKFLEKALEIAEVTYSLHLAKTHEFIETFVEKLGGEIDLTKSYEFPIPHMFEFHTQEKVEYSITLYRILKL
jgi:putative methylase